MYLTSPKTKTSKKGNELTLEQLRTTARAFKSSKKQAKIIEFGSSAKAEAVSGVSFMVISRNAKQRNRRKYERRCYRFGKTTIFPKTRILQDEKWSVTSGIEMITLQTAAKLNRNI